MKNFSNFKLYKPDDKVVPSALYLRDDKGNDWYSVVESFSSDTLKMSYCADGVIVACETDASGLFPVNLSVVEIAKKDFPPDILITDGSWRYVDGKLQQAIDHVAIATAERDSRMNIATTRINWLAAAQEDGDASASEEAELTALRTYRTALRRLDLTTAPDIEWPKAPVA